MMNLIIIINPKTFWINNGKYNFFLSDTFSVRTNIYLNSKINYIKKSVKIKLLWIILPKDKKTIICTFLKVEDHSQIQSR